MLEVQERTVLSNPTVIIPTSLELHSSELPESRLHSSFASQLLLGLAALQIQHVTFMVSLSGSTQMRATLVSLSILYKICTTQLLLFPQHVTHDY